MTMSKCFIPVFFLLFFSWLVSSTASAQDGTSSSSLAAGSTRNVNHVPSNEITLAGTIQQVSSEHTPGNPFGFHVFVNSPQGVVDGSVDPNLTIRNENGFFVQAQAGIGKGSAPSQSDKRNGGVR
jgi:hypothetical protein